MRQKTQLSRATYYINKNFYANDILFFDTLSAFPGEGKDKTVYVTRDTGIMYIWNGSAYTSISGAGGAGGIWGGITGNILDQTDLQTALSSKANTVHSHSIPNVTGLQTALDGKSNTGHGHAIADVTGLQTALDGKSNTTHNHDTSYSALGHTHDDRYYTETETDTLLSGKSNTGHGHAIADVTGLQTALDGKAPTVHNHDDLYFTESEVSTLVSNSISAIVDAAPGTLDTLNELAAALGDDPNFATTVATSLGNKVDGPASSTDNYIPIWNGATGKLLKSQGVWYIDASNIFRGGTAVFSSYISVQNTSVGAIISEGGIQFSGSVKGFYDSTGKAYMTFGPNNSTAVNYIRITHASTGVAPKIDVQGGNANIDLELSSRGTGKILITGGFKSTASTVDTGHFKSTLASGASGGAGIQAYCDDGAAIASGDRLAFYTFGGANDAAGTIKNASAIQGFATENFSGTANGSNLVFEVTPNGTNTRQTALTIGQDKSLTSAGEISGTNLSGTNTGDNAVNSNYVNDYRAANFIAGTHYQEPITLTTVGSSGAATLVGNTLNIPNYAGAGGGSIQSGSFQIDFGNATNPVYYATKTVIDANVNTSSRPLVTFYGTPGRDADEVEFINLQLSVSSVTTGQFTVYVNDSYRGAEGVYEFNYILT